MSYVCNTVEKCGKVRKGNTKELFFLKKIPSLQRHGIILHDTCSLNIFFLTFYFCFQIISYFYFFSILLRYYSQKYMYISVHEVNINVVSVCVCVRSVSFFCRARARNFAKTK